MIKMNEVVQETLAKRQAIIGKITAELEKWEKVKIQLEKDVKTAKDNYFALLDDKSSKALDDANEKLERANYNINKQSEKLKLLAQAEYKVPYSYKDANNDLEAFYKESDIEEKLKEFEELYFNLIEKGRKLEIDVIATIKEVDSFRKRLKDVKICEFPNEFEKEDGAYWRLIGNADNITNNIKYSRSYKAWTNIKEEVQENGKR